MVHTHSPVTGASVMPRSPHILPIELEPVPRAAGPVREPSRFSQTDHKPWNRIVYRDFRYWRFSGRSKMKIQVDEVQMVPEGFGFHIQASEYTWITLVFETKSAAETAHGHAAKAVANATAVKIVNR